MDNSTQGPCACRLADLAPELASTVVRVAGDIALVIDAGGVIRSVADGSLPLQGEQQGWVGRPWADTVNQTVRGKAQALLQEAQECGVSRRRELNHPSAEGDIPVSWTAVRLGDHGPLLAVGRDLRTVSAIQQRFLDVQREIEHDHWQRRNAESHYRLLFQVAHDAVVVLDAATFAVIESNPAAAAMFGPALREGQPLRPAIEAALRPALDELLVTARASGHGGELRLRTAAESTRVDVSATPFGADGRHCLLVRARRAGTSANETQGVLDFIGQTPDAVVVTDPVGRVLWANPAFVDLCRAPDEPHLKGRLLADVLGDEQQQWMALLARVRARGIVGRAAVSLHVPGAPALAADVSAALLAEGDQEHIGFTLRPLTQAAATGGDAEELILDINALVGRLGREPLPSLLAEASRRVEAHLIQAALRQGGGRLDAASDTLRINTQALVLRMGQLDLPLPLPRGSDGGAAQVN